VDEREGPSSFFPTFQSLLLPEEWKKFDFSKEEEKEILQKRGLVSFPSERVSSVEHKKEEKETKTRKTPPPPPTLPTLLPTFPTPPPPPPPIATWGGEKKKE